MTINKINPSDDERRIQQKQESSHQESSDAIARPTSPTRKSSSSSFRSKIWNSFSLTFASKSFKELAKNLELSPEESRVLVETDTNALIEIAKIPDAKEIIVHAVRDETPEILKDLTDLYKEGKLQTIGEQLKDVVGSSYLLGVSLKEAVLLTEINIDTEHLQEAFQNSSSLKKVILECLKNNDQETLNLIESFSSLEPLGILLENKYSLQDSITILKHLGTEDIERFETFREQCQKLDLTPKEALAFSELDSKSRLLVTETFQKDSDRLKKDTSNSELLSKLLLLERDEIKTFLEIYESKKDKELLINYFSLSSAPSFICFKKLQELDTLKKVTEFQTNYIIFRQFVDLIDQKKIGEISALNGMDSLQIQEFSKFDIPLELAPFFETNFKEHLQNLFLVCKDSSLKFKIINTAKNRDYETVANTLLFSSEYANQLEKLAEEKGFSVSKENLLIEGAFLSKTPERLNSLIKELVTLEPESKSIVENLLSKNLPLSACLDITKKCSPKQIDQITSLLPNNKIEQMYWNQIESLDFDVFNPDFFEGLAYFDEITPKIQNLAGGRFSQKDLDIMKTEVSLTSVVEKGPQSIKESFDEFIRIAEEIQNKRPIIFSLEEIMTHEDLNIMLALMNLRTHQGMEETFRFLDLIVDTTLCSNSQSLHYAIEGSYKHYSRTEENLTSRFNHVADALATECHPCIDLTQLEDHENVDCNHLRPEIHFVDPQTQETYSLTMELPFKGEMSVEELKEHLKILDIILRGSEKREAQQIENHRNKYPQITPQILAFSKEIEAAYKIGAISFNDSKELEKGWGRLTTPHTYQLQTLDTPTPLDLTKAAAEGHIYKSKEGDLSLTPPDIQRTQHPVSIESLKAAVNKDPIPCLLPVLKNGEIKETEGKIELKAEKIAWGGDAELPLIRLRASYQAENASTTRDSYFEIEKGESESDAIHRILNLPDFERGNLLDFSKYLRERLDENNAY